MKIKMISLALLIMFVLIGCVPNKLDLEGATKIDIYNWENKDLIHTIEDASFIENLVTKLNKANGEKISDTADIAMLPYKIHFKNKEGTILRICSVFSNSSFLL
ncbi:hypothetical protein [Sutcliffiella horikoshii]|uniref:hypothetical protein n=1 Tax=Sutcliffiella horikoshii TaxID=79883 RepID=UPI0038500DB3